MAEKFNTGQEVRLQIPKEGTSGSQTFCISDLTVEMQSLRTSRRSYTASLLRELITVELAPVADIVRLMRCARSCQAILYDEPEACLILINGEQFSVACVSAPVSDPTARTPSLPNTLWVGGGPNHGKYSNSKALQEAYIHSPVGHAFARCMGVRGGQTEVGS